MLTPFQVANREPVRVGRDQAQAAGVRGQQHTGEDRPQIVLRRRAHDLAQRQRERRRVEPHALAVVRRQPRIVLGRLQPQRRREPAGGDHRLVARDGHHHRSGLELAHDVAQHLRDDRDAGFLDLGRHLDPVRDLQVGADELEAVTRCGDPQILEHWQRASSTRDGALRGGYRVGKSVALAAELHLGLLRYKVVKLGSRSSRGCGLWTKGPWGWSPWSRVLTGSSPESTGAGGHSATLPCCPWL